MINLKPCPFCGGEAHFEWDGHSHDDIGCGDPDCIGHHIACHYVNDDPKEKRELVKSWNTRSPQSEWVDRSVDVVAKDGELFWVVTPDRGVVMARWNDYPFVEHACFQDMANNDEGMCGFKVTKYMKINKPTPPKD